MRNQTMLYWDDEITKKTKENPNLCKNHLFKLKLILKKCRLAISGKKIQNHPLFNEKDKENLKRKNSLSL
jgi:hypothetical protein